MCLKQSMGLESGEVASMSDMCTVRILYIYAMIICVILALFQLGNGEFFLKGQPRLLFFV